MIILKDVTLLDISTVFEGEIPDWHPISYLDTRINEKRVFVARNHEGDAVGFLIYDIWWGNCPFIELIKIRETYQRRGVGMQLLSAVKSELKAKGFSKLISSTEVINPLGLNFHEKAGFQKLNSLDLPHGEEQFYTINL